MWTGNSDCFFYKITKYLGYVFCREVLALSLLQNVLLFWSGLQHAQIKRLTDCLVMLTESIRKLKQIQGNNFVFDTYKWLMAIMKGDNTMIILAVLLVYHIREYTEQGSIDQQFCK